MLEKYKKGDLIFPSAVSRFYHITLADTYILLDQRKDIRKVYMVYCPICNFSANFIRYYSLADLDFSEEIGCENCDTLFLLKPEDVIVLYEKM